MSYHDKNYDGIVLKIPSWFIEMNDLNTVIEILTAALQEANKSMYYPDHVKNLYELANYPNKAEDLKAQAEQKRKDEEAYNKRITDMTRGVFYDLVWETKTGIASSNDDIIIGDETFSLYDITTKSTIKAAYQKLFKDTIKTFDDFVQFQRKNHFSGLMQDLPGADPELLDMGSLNLYYSKSGMGGIGISYRRLYVKTDWRVVNNKLNYRTYPLIKIDGVYGINKNWQLDRADMLDPAFVKSGMSLVKK